MLENYLKYLEMLDEKLNRFFERQKPYIFCKKGCGKCCKGAQFPYSQIELAYLMHGATQLAPEIQQKIDSNIAKILYDKKDFKGEVFRYDCPFLIDNVCSVYEYRGIVCRSFGLMEIDPKGGMRAPFCYEQGLNYSNVMSDDGKTVSAEKFKALNVKEEPIAFNVNYKLLTDDDFANGYGFVFGDKQPLIDWFEINPEDLK